MFIPFFTWSDGQIHRRSRSVGFGIRSMKFKFIFFRGGGDVGCVRGSYFDRPLVKTVLEEIILNNQTTLRPRENQVRRKSVI